MEIRKLSGHVGAELTGVALDALDEPEFAKIRDALFEHGVVVFPDQDLSCEGHIALAERFGKIDINRFFNAVPDYPMIAEVRTAATQGSVIGGTWHTDHSYDPAPAMCSILAARELPDFGGDTCFASQTAAYEHLSDGLAATLEGLKAWHSDASFATGEVEQGLRRDNIGVSSLHPVIIRHPQTGRKALYVNGDFTTHFDGWSPAESADLLGYLYSYCTQPAFCCRVSYAPGTVVIWDNRLVQHFAVADYFGQSRCMHRITVAGQVLSG